MPKKKKTREEKVKSAYRLQNWKLKESEIREKKDQSEFGYLSKSYIGKDLLRTAVFSLVILAMLLVTKQYFG